MSVSVMYEVFLRNYPNRGNLRSLAHDLKRLKELGVDCIWLMPITYAGKNGRKGLFGSPYASRDYLVIDPMYGSLQEFTLLANRCHDFGMKLMVDIVFHHCALDSSLLNNHGDWILKDDEGRFTRKIADWSDVYDLDFRVDELSDYLIEALKKWVERGVDGFRCDVAPLIPHSFWQKAREQLNAINPDLIWLAESVEKKFIQRCHKKGWLCSEDKELYPVFDLTYDYDLYENWRQAIKDRQFLFSYLDELERQWEWLPHPAGKMRFLENHDQLRAAHLIDDYCQMQNWIAWMASLPGAFLLYQGQEFGASESISLFDPHITQFPSDDNALKYNRFYQDVITWKKQLPQAEIPRLGRDEEKAVVWLAYSDSDKEFLAFFNFYNQSGSIVIPADLRGRYMDWFTREPVDLTEETMSLCSEPTLLWRSKGEIV